MGVVQRTGGIDGFFESVFGFLRRKTDFYSNQKEAESVIVKHSHTQFKKYAEVKKAEELAAQKKKEKEDLKRKFNDPERERPPPPPPKLVEKTEEDKKEEKEEKRGLPGNGGSTEKYTWT